MVDTVVFDPLAEEARPPMVASLSPSSMATWRQCPKRFFFEKILRIETETAEPAVCGSFVHLVLQHLMDRPAAERTAEVARRIAAERWPSFIADPGSRFAELGLDAEETRAFKRRAWAGVSGYFLIEDPTRIEVLGVEEEVRADLDGAPVYGIVDRVDRGRDGLVVTDYKSGKAPAWDDEREEKLGQLRTYAAMLEANGRPVAELRLLFVSPQIAASAKVCRCDAEVTAAMARLAEALPGRTTAALIRAVDEVEAAHRATREAAPDRDRARVGAEMAAGEAARAVAAALAGGDGPVAAALAGGDGSDIAALVLAAFAARRKAFFARRAADAARPTTVCLRVGEADLARARDEASTIWAEASACYQAWEFPGRTGALCDWCPFAARCEAFSAWDAAGRPRPPALV